MRKIIIPPAKDWQALEVMAFIIPEDILNEQLELINSAELVCNEIYLAPLSLFNFFISMFR